MPLRACSADLATHLNSSVLSLALCVKVTRLDGTILGFTTHDASLLVDGVTYQARSSVEPSAIRQETEGIDNLEIIGLLHSSDITEVDILAGRYDGAAIEFFMVNFRDLTDGKLILMTGVIGEVSHSSGQFTAEILGLGKRLRQAIGELTSPVCRVKQLGDTRCKVVLTPYRHVRTVSQIDSIYQVRFNADGQVTDYYTYGKVEVTSGANNGFHREIKDHTNSAGVAIVVLQESFPFAFQVGDSVVLEAGCDRRFSSCKDKFNNVVNFRGEPHMPGTNRILKRGRK